jgi:enhancing lycopene biosynthesis protein 2
MGYVQTICFRPKLEKTNRINKLTGEEKLKKLIFSERVAFDRQLFDLSNFYQKKINKLIA